MVPLMLGVVYLVWGSTYLAIKVMVETMPALLASGVRFALAGAIFALWRGVRVTRRELAGCAVVGVLLLLGGNGLVAVGEDGGVPSGLAALIVASVPLWVVVLRGATGDGAGTATIGWVALGFAGVALRLLSTRRTGAEAASGRRRAAAAATGRRRGRGGPRRTRRSAAASRAAAGAGSGRPCGSAAPARRRRNDRMSRTSRSLTPGSARGPR
jgi:hypothetical protein